MVSSIDGNKHDKMSVEISITNYFPEFQNQQFIQLQMIGQEYLADEENEKTSCLHKYSQQSTLGPQCLF